MNNLEDKSVLSLYRSLSVITRYSHLFRKNNGMKKFKIILYNNNNNSSNNDGKHSRDSLQKTAILGTSHIEQKVLQCEA
jgi:hypothetical protein